MIETGGKKFPFCSKVSDQLYGSEMMLAVPAADAVTLFTQAVRAVPGHKFLMPVLQCPYFRGELAKPLFYRHWQIQVLAPYLPGCLRPKLLICHVNSGNSE